MQLFTTQGYYEPSASRAMSCRRPVVPRSMPVLSSSSLSRNELAVEESERSVTWPTFIGRPANSKPFSCSKAFFAHSASANLERKPKEISHSSCWHCCTVKRAKAVRVEELRPMKVWRMALCWSSPFRVNAELKEGQNTQRNKVPITERIPFCDCKHWHLQQSHDQQLQWTGLPQHCPERYQHHCTGKLRIYEVYHSKVYLTIMAELEVSLHQNGPLDGKSSREEVEYHSSKSIQPEKRQQASKAQEYHDLYAGELK
ncbi:hypothetical protein INR49_013370 [Caranx melampygus]|nr:hypothetical protein INR49_013370 [Caranx melampygus]